MALSGTINHWQNKSNMKSMGGLGATCCLSAMPGTSLSPIALGLHVSAYHQRCKFPIVLSKHTSCPPSLGSDAHVPEPGKRFTQR